MPCASEGGRGRDVDCTLAELGGEVGFYAWMPAMVRRWRPAHEIGASPSLPILTRSESAESTQAPTTSQPAVGCTAALPPIVSRGHDARKVVHATCQRITKLRAVGRNDRHHCDTAQTQRILALP